MLEIRDTIFRYISILHPAICTATRGQGDQESFNALTREMGVRDSYIMTGPWDSGSSFWILDLLLRWPPARTNSLKLDNFHPSYQE